MAAIAFDTLKFARRLKEVGVPEAQAEAQAEQAIILAGEQAGKGLFVPHLGRCREVFVGYRHAHHDCRTRARGQSLGKRLILLQKGLATTT